MLDNVQAPVVYGDDGDGKCHRKQTTCLSSKLKAQRKSIFSEVLFDFDLSALS